VRIAVRIVSLLCLVGASVLVVQAQTAESFFANERALVGREWRLVSMGPTMVETGVVPGTNVTLKFSDAGRVNGSTGCNNYGGAYSVQGATISFGAMLSTRRACVDQRANRQEQQFLAAFDTATRFRVADNRLTIYYSGGRNALNFVDANAPSTDEPRPTDDNPVAALSSYYAAINERHYEQAYRYWESPASSFERFVRGFADTERSRLFVDPLASVEGAAGSLYAQIPTIVIAETRSGGERFFAGCYTMRRRNDPQGSWRIYRANLSPVSATAALRQQLSASCQK
jgi:heat shock protein HslJ